MSNYKQLSMPGSRWFLAFFHNLHPSQDPHCVVQCRMTLDERNLCVRSIGRLNGRLLQHLAAKHSTGRDHTKKPETSLTESCQARSAKHREDRSASKDDSPSRMKLFRKRNDGKGCEAERASADDQDDMEENIAFWLSREGCSGLGRSLSVLQYVQNFVIRSSFMSLVSSKSLLFCQRTDVHLESTQRLKVKVRPKS